MLRRVKIVGERGRWLAKVQDRMLPVIHNTWRVGTCGYRDPMSGVKTDGKRYLEYIERLRVEDMLVMQQDAKDGSLARDGYIGVFEFKDLSIGDDGSIGLTLTKRVADPRRTS